jgi:hypothetical protein
VGAEQFHADEQSETDSRSAQFCERAWKRHEEDTKSREKWRTAVKEADMIYAIDYSIQSGTGHKVQCTGRALQNIGCWQAQLFVTCLRLSQTNTTLRTEPTLRNQYND